MTIAEALREAIAWNETHTNCLLTGPLHADHNPPLDTWRAALDVKGQP